jgi:hypothetical protein
MAMFIILLRACGNGVGKFHVLYTGLVWNGGSSDFDSV